jgi:hypothetical protein
MNHVECLNQKRAALLRIMNCAFENSDLVKDALRFWQKRAALLRAKTALRFWNPALLRSQKRAALLGSSAFAKARCAFGIQRF